MLVKMVNFVKMMKMLRMKIKIAILKIDIIFFMSCLSYDSILLLVNSKTSYGKGAKILVENVYLFALIILLLTL